MTVCGLVRLDGSDARRSTLTAMLAASFEGLPAARAVHVDGPFGVVTAPASPSRAMPAVAVDRDGLVVVVDSVHDHTDGADGTHADGADGWDAARRLAIDFRAQGRRGLEGGAGARVATIWEPRRRRLVVARDGRAARDLLTWSDGQIFAFGTEAAHLVAAGLPRSAAVGSIGRQTVPRLASMHRLAPGDRVWVHVTASRPRRGRRVLRLAPQIDPDYSRQIITPIRSLRDPMGPHPRSDGSPLSRTETLPDDRAICGDPSCRRDQAPQLSRRSFSLVRTIGEPAG